MRAPLPSRREPEEEPTAVRIQRLQEMMAAGRAAADAGRYDDALRSFDAVVQQFPDFATTEYSRLARALTLYQLGRTSDAILALEVGCGGRVLCCSGAAGAAVVAVPAAASPPPAAASSWLPQDLEVSLRGYAEVHAALASILYVERPALLDFAEQQ